MEIHRDSANTDPFDMQTKETPTRGVPDSSVQFTVYWEAGLFLTTPFTAGCDGFNYQTSPCPPPPWPLKLRSVQFVQFSVQFRSQFSSVHMVFRVWFGCILLDIILLL
jgi:hypothetical protein